MGYTIIRPASHDEWLRERLKGIGSSDAGTIMGASPFSTPLRLWRQRMGLDPPVKETQAMRNGHFLEPAVAEYFADATGAAIEYESEGDWMAVDDESPWLRVSPDRLFYPEGFEQTKENWCILEIKSTSKPVDKANLPLYWVCQVQYQMGVMGIGMAAIAWVTGFPRLTMDHAWIRFNPAFYATLKGAVDRFWKDNILGGVEPEALDPVDTLLKYPSSVDRKACTASGDDLDNCRRYLELRSEREQLDEEILRVETAIKSAIRDAEVMTATDPSTGELRAVARFKSTNESRFDEEAFRRDHPKEYGLYLKSVFDRKELESSDKALYGQYLTTVKGPRRFSVLPTI